MLTFLLNVWDRYLSPHSRMKRLPARILAHLEPNSDILDVGSYDGALAERLVLGDPTISLTAVDVVVAPTPRMPVLRYDGHRLPFADDAFDIVTLIDVLHHDDHPEAVLGEAARVARRKVVIKDHYWNTRLERWILRLSDFLGNRHRGINLPNHYLKPAEWDALFDTAGLRVIKQETFRYGFLDRCNQVIFVAGRR
ncbi:class I SAM-dependent methyltransferase [Thalassospiraceae bacterium LMO-SO8]|nr:methyltransferase domain-containing protein [Alphaproteobacteria bacterium LMO-S08]WND76671.1 class I SAM-dependent methyltransferase [Thalassospiraceae bacterium LMO-SO8]